MVEHQLPKLRVAGSNPVVRSRGTNPKPAPRGGFRRLCAGPRSPLKTALIPLRTGGLGRNWGAQGRAGRKRDSYLGSDLAEPRHDDAPYLDRVERLADASHWVHHDEAVRVNELLIDFFGGATA